MKVTIDDRVIDVLAGTTILQAARLIDERDGTKIAPPTMCYYSKLKETGGYCRTCIVKVEQGSEKDPRPMPKPVVSCRTTVMDGMVVRNTTSHEIEQARAGIVELLLINHPLDCPICDQAGECHLQDLGFENGKQKTRYEFERRTFAPTSIGDKIKLHMNRCILCYRCVKVCEQITNGRVHGVINRGDHAEISTYIENAIENDFSGNVIDVCPVGALTDKTFRFKSRVWFLKPYEIERNCDRCCGKAVGWMFGNEIYRVTARKDIHGEVEEFICNTCRFDKKQASEWKIGAPRHFDKNSVINQNNYFTKPKKVVIATDDTRLL